MREKEIYKVKAITCGHDNDVEICGYLMFRGDEVPCVTDDGGENFWEVNPYSICANTGVIINDYSAFEYDVFSFKEPLSPTIRFGYIAYNETYKRYVMVTSSVTQATRPLDKCYDIQYIGRNIVVGDKDLEWFEEYSKKEYAQDNRDVEPECRSKAHLNKIAKRFL